MIHCLSVRPLRPVGVRPGMWVVRGRSVGIVTGAAPGVGLVAVDWVDGRGVTVCRRRVRVRLLRQARRSEIPAARLAGVDPGWLEYLGYRD